jgi:hypothetical protein
LKLIFQENIVQLPENSLQLRLPILDARLLGDKVIVIHDYMAFPEGRPAANLLAYSLTGKKLWVAENPSAAPADAFVNFISEEPLQVGNFAGYKCTISLESGKLITSEFTK